eukprot:2691830-Rhodomonas_salina.2
MIRWDAHVDQGRFRWIRVKPGLTWEAELTLLTETLWPVSSAPESSSSQTECPAQKASHQRQLRSLFAAVVHHDMYALCGSR